MMDMVHVQQQENGDLENQKFQNICSCFYLIIYRILLKLKFRKQIYVLKNVLAILGHGVHQLLITNQLIK